MKDKKLMARWIRALKSGKYNQGQEWLNRYNQYCCLGVLCDLINPKGWVAKKNGEETVYSWKNTPRAVEVFDRLPIPVRNKIGLTGDDQSSLIIMNDVGKSFETIAVWIKTNL